MLDLGKPKELKKTCFSIRASLVLTLVYAVNINLIYTNILYTTITYACGGFVYLENYMTSYAFHILYTVPLAAST